jgi:hypothetical protein
MIHRSFTHQETAMTRVDGLAKAMRQWMLLTAIGAFALGCPRPESKIRGDLVREAESNYTYGSERPPVPVDTTIINAPGGKLPTITISTASQTSSAGRVPGNKFIYRLTSSDPYPRMGLARGVNYIWRDTSSDRAGEYGTLVVPKDGSSPMVWLKRDTTVTSYAPLPAVEPRLVKSALGFGACDNNCVPHCATRELLRTFSNRDTVIILRP